MLKKKKACNIALALMQLRAVILCLFLIDTHVFFAHKELVYTRH